MYKCFQNVKRAGFGSIEDRATWRIPTPPVAPGALPGKDVVGKRGVYQTVDAFHV